MITPAEPTIALLRFQSRTGFERVFEVTGEGTMIGSRVDADIRVGVPGIPREACMISGEDGELRITEVAEECVMVDNQTPIEGQVLASGNSLQIGPARFLIEILE